MDLDKQIRESEKRFAQVPALDMDRFGVCCRSKLFFVKMVDFRQNEKHSVEYGILNTICIVDS